MSLNLEIKKYLSEMKVELSPEKVSDIDIYLFLDAFTILPFIKKNSNIVDVGTGSGFPGLALKLFCGDLKITLIDSSSKKCVFLTHISNLLNMKDVNVIWGRAEEIGRDISHREKYDYACCRAVASMSSISELCIPFLKIGGEFIASKGKDIKDINQAEGAIKSLGGEIKKIENIKYSFFNEEKNIVIVSKDKGTPEKYPRRNGMPQKRPLKA